jgi:hypothetical protein
MTVDAQQDISAQPEGSFSVFASAARTASPDTQQFHIVGRRSDYDGLVLVVDCTVAGVLGFTVTVMGLDEVSGKTWTVLTSATLGLASGGVATTVLRVGPLVPKVTNLTAQDYVPPIFQVAVTHLDAVTSTYSVGGWLA